MTMQAHRFWLLQRLTAILLLPLSYFPLALLHSIMLFDYQQTIEWLHQPICLIGIIAWFILSCYHACLGLQVVFEDYIASNYQQPLIRLTQFLFALMCVLAFYWLMHV